MNILSVEISERLLPRARCSMCRLATFALVMDRRFDIEDLEFNGGIDGKVSFTA
jgi:hypothetical protein